MDKKNKVKKEPQKVEFIVECTHQKGGRSLTEILEEYIVEKAVKEYINLKYNS